MRLSLVVTLLALAIPTIGLVACGEDTPAQVSCTEDGQCASGQVCISGVCGTVPCTATGDCASTQVCLLSLAEPVCGPAECGCLDEDTCQPCPEGAMCVDGQCVEQPPETTVCTDDAGCPEGLFCDGGVCVEGAACEAPEDCGDDEVCDAGSCRPCEADECEEVDCTTAGCEEGMVCDPDTLSCVPAPTIAMPCAACTVAEDCAGAAAGWGCVPLSSGQACLAPCGSSDDCETGWNCMQGFCRPAGNACTGCMLEGCDAGLVCDTESGNCMTAKAPCEECLYDRECGPGAACHQLADNNRYCVLRCSVSPCSAGSECVVDDTSGYQVCSPTSGVCCVGDDCGGCDPPCDSATPHCVEGQCLECLQDSDCSSTFPVCQDGVCTNDTGCTGDKPYFDVDLGCVECLNDGHCPEADCNTSLGICGDCPQCEDPYPACTEVDGQTYCVQCTTDAHCPNGGTCNLTTFACEGGLVSSVPTCEPGDDSTCDPGITGFDLYCDEETGLCRDKTGQCDEITAFCAPGKDCLSFLEAFGGVDIPLPTGGATVSGFCECEACAPIWDIQNYDPNCEPEGCPSGTSCFDLADILGALAGGSGGAGMGGSFCFDL